MIIEKDHENNEFVEVKWDTKLCTPILRLKTRKYVLKFENYGMIQMLHNRCKMCHVANQCIKPTHPTDHVQQSCNRSNIKSSRVIDENVIIFDKTKSLNR